MSLIQKLLRIPHKAEQLSPNLKAYQLQRAYVRLFLGPDGNLTPDAQIVLADLNQACGLTAAMPVRKLDGGISNEDTYINLGKREILIGIYRRIFKKQVLVEGSTEEQDIVAQTLIEELKET